MLTLTNEELTNPKTEDGSISCILDASAGLNFSASSCVSRNVPVQAQFSTHALRAVGFPCVQCHLGAKLIWDQLISIRVVPISNKFVNDVTVMNN